MRTKKRLFLSDDMLPSREHEASVEGVDEEKKQVQFSFASTIETDRWFGKERLIVNSQAMDISRIGQKSVNLLLNHKEDNYLGRVLKVWFDDVKERAYCEVEFSYDDEMSKKWFDRIKNGHVTTVSFALNIKENGVVLSEIDEESDHHTYDLISYELMEISIVTVPRNAGVGIGKSSSPLNDNQQKAYQDLIDNVNRKYHEENDMTVKIKKDGEGTVSVGLTDTDRAIMVREATKYGAMDLLERAFSQSMSLTDFRGELLEQMNKGGNAPIDTYSQEKDPLGLSEGDVRQFSISRAIWARTTGDRSIAKHEIEITEAYAASVGGSKDVSKTIYVPMSVMQYSGEPIMNPDPTTSGRALIQTEVRAGSMIEMLRSKGFLDRVGVQFLTGLVNNLSFPKQTTQASASWLPPGGEAPITEVGVEDDVYMAPKYLGVRTWYDTDLVANASLEVESFVKKDIAGALRLKMERAFISGTGQGFEPLGLINNNDIKTITLGPNGGELNWDAVVNMETEIEAEDFETTNAYYLVNTRTKGKLKRTRIDTDMPFIWQDGTINDTTAIISNIVPSNLQKGNARDLSAVFYGDFSTCMIGVWGALKIVVNPYRHDKRVYLSNYLNTNFGYRQPKTLTKIVDARTK